MYNGFAGITTLPIKANTMRYEIWTKQTKPH